MILIIIVQVIQEVKMNLTDFFKNVSRIKFQKKMSSKNEIKY